MVVSWRDLRPAPFFAARAISPFLLAKDTTIVNAVNERFGLGDPAYCQYVAEVAPSSVPSFFAVLVLMCFTTSVLERYRSP